MRRFSLDGSGRWAAGLFAVTLMLASLGCQRATEGPARFDVSGKVTFNGQPVPSGTIFFEPDAATGNQGPQGFAKIVDGHYDTSDSGKGVVGGAHVVRIEGQQEASEEQAGTMLFQDYRQKVDLPKESTTQDFEVPAAAGQNVPQVEPA